MQAPDISGLTDFVLLGEGNTFTVWKARQASLDRDVEVRQFSNGLSKAQVAHQIRMARLLAKLNHDAILQVFDVNADATPPYILTEHNASPSLSDLIEERGIFSTTDALLVAKGVAEALAYVCTQFPLIIRNLKPQNIHLDAAGKLKLTDFSLAIIANDPDDGPAVDGNDLVGTPNFVSPEHAAGLPDIDPRSDMYSLGMVLYYLVTRKIPFDLPDPIKTFDLQKDGQLPDPREANPLLSPQFVGFLFRLTMKAPQHRYAIWGDVLSDIRRLLAGKSPTTFKMPPNAMSSIVSGDAVAETEAETKKKRRYHPIWWLLLLLWLAWLANCRLQNPLRLPPKFAPYISIPVLDNLLERGTGTTAPEAPDDSAPSSDSPDEDTEMAIPPTPSNPYATMRESPAPTAEAPVEDRARPQEQQPTQSFNSVPQAPATPPPPPARPSDDSARTSALAPAIGELVRQGDFAAAKARCEEIGTSEARATAAFLDRIPSPEEAVRDAFLARQGQMTSLRYMGKWRTVTPLRLDGSSLVVKFTDQNGLTREIPLSLAKIDAADKVSFLNSWARTPEQHAAAAVVALQAGNDWAYRRHASEAGPLAAFLAPRP